MDSEATEALDRRKARGERARSGAYQDVYRTPGKTISPEARSRLESTIRDLAPKAGLRVGRIEIDDDAIWVEVCR